MVIKKITEKCFNSLSEVKPYDVLSSLKHVEFNVKFNGPMAVTNSFHPKRIFHKIIEKEEFERYSKIVKSKLI